MTQLILMLFFGILLLSVGLFALSHAPRAKNAGCSDSEVELLRILRLPSLEFDAANLFSDADYRALVSEPRLRSLASELRKDRKAIALVWLADLQKDVFCMWRFRSFLTRFGASGMRDELLEAVRSLRLLWLLCIVRVSVRLLGLYAFGRTALTIRIGVEKIKQSCAAALNSLPRERRAQIASAWQSAQTV